MSVYVLYSIKMYALWMSVEMDEQSFHIIFIFTDVTVVVSFFHLLILFNIERHIVIKYFALILKT